MEASYHYPDFSGESPVLYLHQQRCTDDSSSPRNNANIRCAAVSNILQNPSSLPTLNQSAHCYYCASHCANLSQYLIPMSPLGSSVFATGTTFYSSLSPNLNECKILLSIARQCFIRDEFAPALRILDRYFALGGAEVDAYFLRAELLLRSQWYLDAVDAFTYALNFRPADVPGLISRAYAYAYCFDFDRAYMDLARANLISPKNKNIANANAFLKIREGGMPFPSTLNPILVEETSSSESHPQQTHSYNENDFDAPFPDLESVEASSQSEAPIAELVDVPIPEEIAYKPQVSDIDLMSLFNVGNELLTSEN